jgi:hypothetical protein
LLITRAILLAKDDRTTQALQEIQKIQDEYERARGLGLLAPFLPETQMQEALTIINGIRNPDTRMQALSALAPYLSPAQLSLSLERIQRIGDLTQQVACLARFAPNLVHHLRYRVIAFTGWVHKWTVQYKYQVEARKQGLDRSNLWSLVIREFVADIMVVCMAGMSVYIFIKAFYADTMKEAVTDLGVGLALIIALLLLGDYVFEFSISNQIQYALSRRKRLKQLGIGLPVSLEDGLNTAINIQNDRDRRLALAYLTAQWVKQPPEEQNRLWWDALVGLSRLSRQDLLLDLRILKPVLRSLCGRKINKEITEAIINVCRWWP